MKTQQLLKSLTTKDAQAMYSAYYPLKPDHVLAETLEALLQTDVSYIENIRDFYNSAILLRYPNEATIKAAFLNQVLFKQQKDITVFELPVGGSRVDLCKINGSSIAYEIKTKYDNLNRLGKQLADYQKVFEQVYVICSTQHVDAVKKSVPPGCGIFLYSYDKKYHFEKICESTQSMSLNSAYQLGLFRKAELAKYFPSIAHFSKTEAIKTILEECSFDEINSRFKEMLKNRFSRQWSFLAQHHQEIYAIDYQWFYHNNTPPQIVYGTDRRKC